MKKLEFLQRAAAAAVISAAGGSAMATCSSNFDSLAQTYALFGLSSYLSSLSSYQDFNPGCFSTTDPNNPQQVSATSFNQMNAVNQVLGNRLLGGSAPSQVASLSRTTGLAAGATPGGWNSWANLNDDKNSYKVSNLAVVGAAASPFFFDSTNSTRNVVVGADYGLSKSMVVGVSVAMDASNGRNVPGNPATGATATSTSASGQSLSLYAGSLIDRNWAIDAMVGIGLGKSNPSSNTTADSTRRFVGANLNYANWIGNWQINGKASYLFGNEEFQNAKNRFGVLPLSAYTARLGQAKVGGEIGYWLTGGVMPFVGVAYVNDVSRNTARVKQLWDEDGVVVTAGINFFSVKNSLVGGIVYTDETNRNFVRHNTWMANVNYRF